MEQENKQEFDFTYEVKCRKCNKVTKMYFGTSATIDINKFHIWAKEHSTFPVQKQCRCDNGSMMFHDLISYSPF